MPTETRIGRRLGLRGLVLFGLFLALISLPPSGRADPDEATANLTEPPATSNRVVKEGIAVELDIASGATNNATLIEARDASIRFTITDAAAGRPLAGLYPSAWMDRRGRSPDALSCQEKIRTFLQGTVAFRPSIDLNTWYIVTLNEKASLSVIDPLISYGGQQLMALVLLDSPGEDWVKTRAADRLFVSQPEIGKVAVVDTALWKVSAIIAVGPDPGRLALQPDERYLWVGVGAHSKAAGDEGGVYIIDTESLAVVGRIRTGLGRHEIAFSHDNRYAFVSNEKSGTVTVIDIRTVSKIKDIETGSHPASLAYSTLGQTLYVVDREDGTISVIDGERHTVAARIQVRPGLIGIRFTPNGRWGFAVNPKTDEVTVIDASLNRIAHTFQVSGGPDQIAFTQSYAYIRPAGTQLISLVELGSLGKEDGIPVVQVPGGQKAPAVSESSSRADVVVATPEETSVLIANPADGIVYYYMEGMGAPMGSYRNRPRQPRAVMVVDKSLAETTPGVYATDLKLPAPGTYDVAFLLDSPRVFHCFTATVNADPATARAPEAAFEMEFLSDSRFVRAATETRLRVRLTDAVTRQAKDGVNDLHVLAYSPGVWQHRSELRPVGDGTYEVAVSLPRAGVYFLYFESATLGLRYNQLPYLVIEAKDEIPAVGEVD